MTQTPPTPAGWYPQGDGERWWDGTQWSDHTRPLQPAAPYGAQPTYQVPAKKSNLVRNLLIVFGVLIVLFVGGCVAVVAIVGNTVENAVNDATPGGPNNPLTIEEGRSFEVAGFEYADGWAIDASGGFLMVEDLKVTNHRGKTDQALVEIRLLRDGEVLASATCVSDGRIPEDVTVTLGCSSGDEVPPDYDQITISDVI